MTYHPRSSYYTSPPLRRWRRCALDWELLQSMWTPMSDAKIAGPRVIKRSPLWRRLERSET